MPSSTFFGDALKDYVKTGKVSQSKIDDSVLRILIPMFKVGVFDKVTTGSIEKNVTSS